MSGSTQWKIYRIVLVVVVILILYNIGSGLIVKKVGIPGIFEVEFGDEPHHQQQAERDSHSDSSTPTQPQSVQPSPTQPQQPPTEQKQAPPPDPTATSFTPPPELPAQTCPYVPGIFWMAYPNTWYGPFEGFALAWNQTGGFYIWSPYAGMVPIPDPYAQAPRNSWFRLTGSPFNVCIDGSTGRVFGQYNP
jgi:hypothetical protein